MSAVFLLDTARELNVCFLSTVVVTKESRAHNEYVGTSTVFKGVTY